MNRCGACKFWDRIAPDMVYENDGILFSDDGIVEQGYCKRYPPVIVSDALREVRNAPLYKGEFYGMTPPGMLSSACLNPVTFDSDSCGEWKPID